MTKISEITTADTAPIGTHYIEMEKADGTSVKVLMSNLFLDFATSTELTISSGSVTPTQNWHTIDTEGDAASDDLDTFATTNATDGFLLIVRANNTARTVVIKHNTGNIQTAAAADITLDETYKAVSFIYDATLAKWVQSGGGAAASTAKGRVEFLADIVPATSGAPITVLAGASSPAESIPYYEFVNGSTTYREYYCRLQDYASGGLTLKFEVMRTSAAAAATYIFDAAIRRINTATEDLGAAHTYDYNSVTVTIPAGPPTATIPMAGTITFTDGSDMDSLATGEAFILRFRRSGGTATDTARVLTSITMKET